jgi:hypothetical protein
MQMKRVVVICYRAILVVLMLSVAEADETTPSERLAGSTDAIQLDRMGNRILVTVDQEPADRSVRIPRIYGRVGQVHWEVQDNHAKSDLITLHPEPTEWYLRWEKGTPFQNRIIIEFDEVPRVASELKPILQSGDGTFTLQACDGNTLGKLLRYEPQPHKNTIGYWADVNDSVVWEVSVTKPGGLNVGLLQGCGKDQGGSDVRLEVLNDQTLVSSLNFNVEETGHFQNFKWRDIGTVAFEKPGVYRIKVVALRIAKNAVMDIRMIHLSPSK